MPTIKGFSTKDPEARAKVMRAIGRSESDFGFKATGWKSDKHSDLVKDEKAKKPKKEVKKKDSLRSRVLKKIKKKKK